uniref:Ig-like domain-containing protein n=1 Tax=Electrophorus electricus TaxID=8005 RepID=A0A4W4E268_ELEEL
CCHFQSLPLCYNTTDNLIALTLDSPDTLILVAEPGDDVTIWYQHNLMEAAFIYWFKQTNHSVPHHVACQLYLQYSSSRPCSLVNQSKHIVMTVNSQNTSLTITGVNYTDSGLYYCGIPRSTHISFSNATYLQVIVVFGGVIVILISVLLVMLKRRKQHQNGIADTFFVLLQEQDFKYAALQFSDKKIKKLGRHTEVVDTKVVYSSVRH